MPSPDQQAQQVSEPTGSDASTMSAFLETYGTPPREEPQEQPSQARQEVEQQDPEFDAETLEALGITPPAEKPEAEKGDDGGADGAHRVDLGEIARAIGVDESDLAFDAEKGVTVRTKVDGVDSTVSLGELRKGYQLQAHFTKQQEQFLAEKAAFEQEKTREIEVSQARAQMAMQVLDDERRQLDASYTLDWDKLRNDDPAEWSARIVQYNQAVNRIEDKKTRLVTGFQEHFKQQQQVARQQFQQQVEQESKKLIEALGWKDRKEAQEGSGKIQSYLMETMGYSPEQLNTFVDHRAYVVADKARRYDEIMAKVSLAKKKVTEAPVMPAESGGLPPTRGFVQKKQAKAAMDRLRQDHSVDAAAEVFKHLKVV